MRLAAVVQGSARLTYLSSVQPCSLGLPALFTYSLDGQQFSLFEEINALLGVSNGCISSCSILHPINHDMKRSSVNESDWNVILTMRVFQPIGIYLHLTVA